MKEFVIVLLLLLCLWLAIGIIVLAISIIKERGWGEMRKGIASIQREGWNFKADMRVLLVVVSVLAIIFWPLLIQFKRK